MHHAVHGHRRRVDAVRGDELVVGREIGGGKPDLAPAFPALDDGAVDEIRMAEKGASLVHATFGHEAADPGAAHHKVLVTYRVDLVSPETVALSERAQHREVAA